MGFRGLPGRRRWSLAASARAGLAAAAAFVLASAAPAADPASECKGEGGKWKLFVAVENVKSVKGSMAMTLYGPDESRFLKNGGSLYVVRFDVDRPVTRTCLRVPGPGRYAVAVYQDANRNGKFDRNFIGIPTEPFGFSRNPKIMFGPPKLKEVEFAVARDGETLTVDLIRM